MEAHFTGWAWLWIVLPLFALLLFIWAWHEIRRLRAMLKVYIERHGGAVVRIRYRWLVPDRWWRRFCMFEVRYRDADGRERDADGLVMYFAGAFLRDRDETPASCPPDEQRLRREVESLRKENGWLREALARARHESFP